MVVAKEAKMYYLKQVHHRLVDHKTGDAMLFLKQRQRLRQHLVLHADQRQQDKDDHSHAHALHHKQKTLMYSQHAKHQTQVQPKVSARMY
jgi:hypothetical protein